MGKPPESVIEIRRRITQVVSDHGPDLVAAYYAPENGFAGDMFDSFGNNPVDRFTADDLVAASLLDVRFGPASVRRLLIEGSANALLEQIPEDEAVTLWNADLGPGSPAWSLWRLLVDIEGVGPTRASKLLARKRPHLMPILDSVITDQLGLGEQDRWRALSEALDERIRCTIAALRDSAGRGAPSLLRLLDVVTWMRFSESERARRVRRELGFDVSRRAGRAAV